MKILDNTKARISAAAGVYVLYAIVPDDYSRMYNVTNLKNFYEYSSRSYDVRGKFPKLKELPILAENFDDLPSLLNKYPELFVWKFLITQKHA